MKHRLRLASSIWLLAFAAAACGSDTEYSSVPEIDTSGTSVPAVSEVEVDTRSSDDAGQQPPEGEAPPLGTAAIDDRLFTGLSAATADLDVTLFEGSILQPGKDFVVLVTALPADGMVVAGICVDENLVGRSAAEVCELAAAGIVPADADGELVIARRYPFEIELDSGRHDCLADGCALVIAVAADTSVRGRLVLAPR